MQHRRGASLAARHLRFGFFRGQPSSTSATKLMPLLSPGHLRIAAAALGAVHLSLSAAAYWSWTESFCRRHRLACRLPIDDPKAILGVYCARQCSHSAQVDAEARGGFGVPISHSATAPVAAAISCLTVIASGLPRASITSASSASSGAWLVLTISQHAGVLRRWRLRIKAGDVELGEIGGDVLEAAARSTSSRARSSSPARSLPW